MLKIILIIINLIFLESYSLQFNNKKVINKNLKYKFRTTNLVLLNNQNSSNNSLDDNETNFPSFNKFLNDKRKKENLLIMKYFNEADKKARALDKQKNNNKYNSKDLKLLSNVETITWTKIWINDITSYNYSVPEFMYKDMFDMRDFCLTNNTKTYFYIAYIPSDKNLKDGPYYIGAFELILEKKEFITHALIQNPNYNYNIKDYNMLNYKKELLKMTSNARVSFKFNNLKEINNLRYYYTWLYDNNN